VTALNLTLQVWRQPGPSAPGRLVRYEAHDISPDMSFLEMLDVVNERLQERGETPIAFDHDCREGICGSCSLMINGVAHGPNPGTATCQLHMRSFRDGDEIRIEPWRARAFPVVRDLVVDRSALDRIIQAGGFVSVDTGGAPDGNGCCCMRTTLAPGQWCVCMAGPPMPVPETRPGVYRLAPMPGLVNSTCQATTIAVKASRTVTATWRSRRVSMKVSMS